MMTINVNTKIATILTGAVERALENTFTGEGVLLELVFDPLWSHERISEEGQEYLNR